MSQIKYYIAIDGGGTFTEMIVFNKHYQMIKKVVVGSININQINIVNFEIEMEKLMVLINDYKHAKICLGVPGYGNSSQLDKFVDTYFSTRLTSPDYQYFIINDAHLASYASFRDENGIMVLAGTGSIAISTIPHPSKSVGGWGYLIADEGSAFAIGKAALTHVTRVFDGFDQPSLLSKLISNEFKFDFNSKILNYVYQSSNYRVSMAVFAPYVDQAANQNCQVALAILDHASEELIAQARILITSEDDKVSYAGGVFNSKYIKTKVISELETYCHVIDPLMPPVLGGIYKLLISNLQSEEEKIQLSKLLITEYNKKKS